MNSLNSFNYAKSIKRKQNNLENIDFKDKNIILDSPRSLLACERLEIESEELYFLDINEFIKKHPEISALPKNIVKIKWDHLEALRNQNIAALKEERNLLYKNSKYDNYIPDINTYKFNSLRNHRNNLSMNKNLMKSLNINKNLPNKLLVSNNSNISLNTKLNRSIAYTDYSTSLISDKEKELNRIKK